MERRSWFGCAIGAATGLLASREPTETAAPATEMLPPVRERDINGKAVCWFFRRTEDERTGRIDYLEVRRADLKPGDTVILLGVTDGRMWRCERIVIEHLIGPNEGNGFAGECTFTEEIPLLT